MTTTLKEYSVTKGYRVTSAVILGLCPYFYYRFFADLVSEGKWPAIAAAMRARPVIMSILLGFPVLTVFVGLVAIMYRFAVDFFFYKTVHGVTESSSPVKTRLGSGRICLQVSGRRFDLLNDIGVAKLLLAEDAVGRQIEMKIGGLNKVLYLRIE